MKEGEGVTTCYHVVDQTAQLSRPQVPGNFIPQNCLQFMQQGYQTIKYYASISQKNRLIFCLGDLATDTSMKYHGNETNVIAEILLSRYDLFTQRGIPTHVTTNLSASEPESIYGNRVRSLFYP